MFKKLGTQSIEAQTPESRIWAQNTPIFKAFNNPSSLDGVPSNVITIWRKYLGDGHGQIERPGDVVADDVINSLGGRHVDYIEGANELPSLQKNEDGSTPDTPQNRAILQEYIDWTRVFTFRAHQRGYKVAGFSFSSGTPEPWAMQILRDNGWAGVDAVAMHTYWCNGVFDPYNAMRWLFLGWRNSDPPIIITEAGRDAIGSNCPAGWRISGVDADQYIGELHHFDDIIASYPYIIGATLFGGGQDSGEGRRWRDFSTDVLTGQLFGDIGPAHSCKRNEVWDDSEQRCNCQGGYVRDANGVCVLSRQKCNNNEVYDESSGTCVPIRQPHYCFLNEVYDETINDCVCIDGYHRDETGFCVLGEPDSGSSPLLLGALLVVGGVAAVVALSGK